MPRYFFNIRRPDSTLVLDDEGAEFEDYETAKNEAMESARDIAIDAIRRGSTVHGLAIEIADETGRIIDTIKARETFD